MASVVTPFQSIQSDTSPSHQGLTDPVEKISLRERMAQKVIFLDGAMGTSIQTYQLTTEDFCGKDGCNDYLSLLRTDLIRDIHASFYAAGCDAVETNTFGSNRIKLEEYGIEDQIVEINTAAVEAAKQAILMQGDNRPRYIIGSMGPTGYLPSSSDPTLSNISVDRLRETYAEQAKILIEAGVDALIIETGQDILEMKHAIIGAKASIAACGRDIVLIAQPTLDATGRMLLGTDMETALPLFIDLGVDVIGLNCSTGPDEMRESVRYLSEHAPMAVSVVPNAGLPENRDGQAVYLLTPEPFAKALGQFITQFGVQIVGGCCGSTPEHLRQLILAVGADIAPAPRQIEAVRSVTSSIKAVSLDMLNRPIIVGERLNSQGSRKFKKLLIEDDYDTMGQMARTQVEEGAHLLDICVALNERDDESVQMCKLVKDLSQMVEAPLVIDSTEYPVIEAALKLVPGRAIVNSIHLEGEGERVHKIAPMLKMYGGSAVAMLIDANGMAKTADRKKEVAQHLYDIITKDYQLPSHTLIFDALTFTLATGEEEFRNSAVETFEAIRWIKANLPHTYTVLGVSNASFGLTPAARKVLNSVYLYHATQAGLDLAIVNAKEIIPYPMLTETERKLSDALVLNENEQALADFITYFENYSGTANTAIDVNEADLVERTIPEQIQYQILNRKKEGIEALLETARLEYAPVDIINQILLPAMKDVGDKMATGELILPFVLQSAEVMKKSVAYLEQFLDKNDTVSKGTLVLATVYGDVHDIGKNLVKTIFSNNGYVVHDLGKQVPLTTILAKAKEVKANAIGLSALLVTTSKQMAYCVEECDKQELHYPIIIGGAAINRDYGFRISCLEEELVYPGGVFYAKDAFEGLRTMNRLMDPNEKESLMAEYHADIEERRTRTQRYQDNAAAPIITTTNSVTPAEIIPTPPFWGMHLLKPEDINIDEVVPHMDFPSLFRLSWGLKNMGKDEYDRMLAEEYHPKLAAMLTECKAHGYFQPEVLYGYFPCYSEGNDLIILHDDQKTERMHFTFPRQTSRDLLCLSDYFAKKDSGRIDVLPLQLVTMGHRIGQFCNELDQSGEYSQSYYYHGLAVQMADGLAEWAHRRVKKELGMTDDQGKRYSFGYPACPDLADQAKQFDIMQVSKYTNITLTEAFQIEPEQSTSAMVVHHPAAKYYSI